MAELTINTDDITAALRKNLEGFKPDLVAAQVGHVLEVGDGIATVGGLPDCAVNEMLEFENGTIGLALNLDEDSIGAVVLGEVGDIEEGQVVRATGEILSVPTPGQQDQLAPNDAKHAARRLAVGLGVPEVSDNGLPGGEPFVPAAQCSQRCCIRKASSFDLFCRRGQARFHGRQFRQKICLLR